MLVVAGAVLCGTAVSKTLGKGLIPVDLVSPKVVLVILIAASASIFSANLMQVPQSTSLSTVSAICGIGLYYSQLNYEKIYFLAGSWVATTAISFLLMFLAMRLMYPPRNRNFWIYEKIVQHQNRLKQFVVLSSFYKAFAQGTNNVANVVGPLSAAGYVSTTGGLLFMGIIFGFGSLVLNGPLKTMSERIVPLGMLSATMINLVAGTVTITASLLGIPLPAIIIYTTAVLTIGVIKDGPETTFDNPMTRKTLLTWGVNPLVTLGMSYFLATVILK